MAALTEGTKTILDAASANIVVKTAIDSGDTTVSPAHAIIDPDTGLLAGGKAKPLSMARTPLVSAAATTIVRPADTNIYATGDFVGSSTTGSSNNSGNSAFVISCARANDIPGILSRCILKKSGTSLASAIFALHWFAEDILAAGAIADNAVFTPSRYTNYIGVMDCTFIRASSNDSVANCVPYLSGPLEFSPISGDVKLHGLLEVRAGYTPISGEVFTLLKAFTE